MSQQERKRSRPTIPGITVYQRGKKWAYTLYLEADILTGKRKRINKSGFETQGQALTAAIKAKEESGQGRYVRPSRRVLADLLAEWLNAIQPSLKPSTHQNYSDYADAYVLPALGGRKLQEITVPTLNAFYQHLLRAGRCKPDNNSLMYEYWRSYKQRNNGEEPKSHKVAVSCNTSIYAARSAIQRYRRGRVPRPSEPGLAPKTIKNIHRMLHRALKDALAWQYISFNPAEHASLPRIPRKRRNRPTPWNIEELASWLEVALTDRFAGMWVLAATTGMRRSELAGVERKDLDLSAATLVIHDTRVVVGGHAQDSDGKTESGIRTIALDSFTLTALHAYLAKLEEERAEFGASYHPAGKLMCFEDGRPLHPDTITRRFNRLVDLAGVRQIRLHDIRHTYATLAMDAGINPKTISDRVGHANLNVTYGIYTHRSTGIDHEAAQHIASLIWTARKPMENQI